MATRGIKSGKRDGPPPARLWDSPPGNEVVSYRATQRCLPISRFVSMPSGSVQPQREVSISQMVEAATHALAVIIVQPAVPISECPGITFFSQKATGPKTSRTKKDKCATMHSKTANSLKISS